ncbi:MAG: hypothetical protein BWZ10_00292 [candidate division BRC1 bacterium ADurb.BinA364]|nr:MAG: hypothetical protein BWZ10_00292 [candidate division BRC1 bacterium ADurb.BinA364]
MLAPRIGSDSLNERLSRRVCARYQEKLQTAFFSNRVRETLALLAIALAGAAVRLTGLESLPPALWFDEGLNGCDALALARGGPWPMVFPAVFPREPLLVYPMAAFVWLIGPETLAVRLPAALIGSAAPALLYLWLRQGAAPRAAFLSAAFLAFMRWHLHFSRFGLRTIWTPTLALAFLGLVWLAARTGKRRHAAAAGAVLGLGFYAYLSWYFFLPVAGLAVWLLMLRGKAQRSAWWLAGALGAAALLAAAPLFVHYYNSPRDIGGRVGELSLFKDGIGPGLRAIGKNALEASMMLVWRGDHVSKHNIPWRPALDPAGAALLLFGLAWALRRCRRDPLAAVLLAWLVCGTLPTVFSYTDSPNFLRTLIVSPAAAALAGLGADAMGGWLEKRKQPALHRAARGLPALAVAASAAASLWLYFGVWPRTPNLWGDFSGQADQVARYVRQAGPRETVFVPSAMFTERYYDSPTFHFLAGDSPRLRRFSYREALGPGPNPAADHLIVESPVFDPRAAGIIEKMAPGARVDAFFEIVGAAEQNGEKPAWARVWRLAPNDRLTGADADALRGLDR